MEFAGDQHSGNAASASGGAEAGSHNSGNSASVSGGAEAGPSNASQDTGNAAAVSGADESNASQDTDNAAAVSGADEAGPSNGNHVSIGGGAVVTNSGSGQSGVQDPFQEFIAAGMTRVAEISEHLNFTGMNFIRGMEAAERDTTITAIHSYLDTCEAHRNRLTTFGLFLQEMRRRCPHTVPLVCLYGGSKLEISRLVKYGFSFVNAIGRTGGLNDGADLNTALYQGRWEETQTVLENEYSAGKAQGGCRGVVQLVSARFSLDAASACDVDEAGLRHVIVCRVITGAQPQVVSDGFQLNPECDYGVDNLASQRRLYIPWGSVMKKVIVESVISFKVPSYIVSLAARPVMERPTFFGTAEPTCGSVELHTVLEGLRVLLTGKDYAEAADLFNAFMEKRRSRMDLVDTLRGLFGDQVLVEAAKLVWEANQYFA